MMEKKKKESEKEREIEQPREREREISSDKERKSNKSISINMKIETTNNSNTKHKKTSFEFSQVALGVTAAATTTAMYYSYKTKANEFPKPKLAFLVFPDSGEKCSTTGGSAPNAITLLYETNFEKLELLKNAVTKELGDEKYGTVRLFVQATKEEIKDGQDLEPIL